MFALTKSVDLSTSNVSDSSLRVIVGSGMVGEGLGVASSAWVSLPSFGRSAEVLWAGRNSAERPRISCGCDLEVTFSARFSLGTSDVFCLDLLMLLVLLLMTDLLLRFELTGFAMANSFSK